MKKIEKWKLIDNTDVSPSRWFPIEKHVVELPSGKIIDDYFVGILGNVVMVLPITKGGNFVLVRQYKHAYDDILIELPAGFQVKGKTLEESALVELEEETGIRTSKDNLESIGKVTNNPTKTTHVTYGYLARDLDFNSKQKLEETEEIEILQIPPIKVLEMIKNGDIIVADSISFILKTFVLYPELFNS